MQTNYATKNFNSVVSTIKLPCNLLIGITLSDTLSKRDHSALVTLNRLLTNFKRDYQDIVRRHATRSLTGLQIVSQHAFEIALSKFGPYKAFKKMLGDSVDQIINSDPCNSIKVIHGITKLLEESHDLELMRQCAHGSIVHVDTVVGDLSHNKQIAARALVAQDPCDITMIEDLIAYAVYRLANHSGLEHKPDVIIYPESSSNAVAPLVNALKTEMCIPAVCGFSRNDLGDITTLNKVLNSTLCGDKPLNVLLVDSHLRRGVTQHAMMTALKSYNTNNIISYAMIKD